MRDRLVTALGALLALVALATILFASPETPPTRPTAEESGANGFAALAAWLRDAGIAVSSHRQRLTDLSSAEFEPGSLLIATFPQHARMRGDEVEALQTWLAAGNTLLILAALNDTPDWAQRADARAFQMDDIESLTGMTFEADDDEAGTRVTSGLPGGENTVRLRPVAVHPLVAGAQALEGVTDQATRLRRVASSDGAARLRLAETENGADAIWHLPRGRGDIFLVSLGSLFTNRAIDRADNRTLMVNLARYHLAPRGSAIFDDFHQGLSALYDPTAFFRDRRLHATIAFVLAWWFVYMVGTWNRLAPVREVARQPEQQDFVRAVGGFLARKVDPVAAGRMMFASWFTALAGRPVAFEAPPWARLDHDPTADATVVRELKADYARLRNGAKVDLKQLHNRFRRSRRDGGAT